MRQANSGLAFVLVIDKVAKGSYASEMKNYFYAPLPDWCPDLAVSIIRSPEESDL